jgi:DNA-binding response OmpR family regulator
VSSRVSALYIEDDARLAALVTELLARHEVDVTVAPDGERGLAAATRGSFDVVLLDLMLPVLDGLEVCRRLRAAGRTVPIIMLTAKGDDVDKIVGLELGADDYLAKPYNPRELLARIRAVLRRAGPVAVTDRLRVGGLEIDFAGREVTVDGRREVLTHYEFELLACLARAAGRVRSRDQLLEALKGIDHDAAFDRSIDVHISKLRAKLEENPREPRYLKTVRGAGYMLARPQDLDPA